MPRVCVWSVVPALALPLLALGSSACVLAVDHRFTVREPVERIVLDLGAGDVEIRGTDADGVEVTVELGGLAAKAPRPEVKDGVLYLDYACGKFELCGGELTVHAPRWVDLQLTVGAGELSVAGMVGEVEARVGTGEITATGLGGRRVALATGVGTVRAVLAERPATVALEVATGDIALDLPGGAYVLDLRATAGTVELDGVSHDPEADASITALTAAGTVTVRGR